MEQKTPRLLTEAEWRDLLAGIHHGTDETLAELRERGLIAEEPVDPDLLEAWKVVGDWALETFGAGSSAVAHYSTSKVVEDTNTRLALAGIKRGKELRPTLTREMLSQVYKSLWGGTHVCRRKHRPTPRRHSGANARRKSCLSLINFVTRLKGRFNYGRQSET